jgi:membrane protease YdiL (CAAX protease family)
LISILPASMLLAYAVQSRQNTWIGLLQHGFVNSGLLVFLILGAIG